MKLILYVGIVTGLIAMYYGYYYFKKQNVLDQENVVIQTNCSSSSTNSDGCNCSENSDCTSGNCYGGTCEHCKGPFGQCESNGNCCESDCINGTCFPIVGTIGAAVVVAGGMYKLQPKNWSDMTEEEQEAWFAGQSADNSSISLDVSSKDLVNNIDTYEKNPDGTYTKVNPVNAENSISSVKEVKEDLELAEDGAKIA